jgi:hypothetical protein
VLSTGAAYRKMSDALPSHRLGEAHSTPKDLFRATIRSIGALMKDYVVYEHPERMVYTATGVDSLAIALKKAASATRGGRVWVIAGARKPRTFSLRSVLHIDSGDRSTRQRYKNAGTARAAYQLFDPMLPLDDEPWFPEFKRVHRNFNFGYRAIKNPRFVRGLIRVVSARFTNSRSKRMRGYPVWLSR